MLTAPEPLGHERIGQILLGNEMPRIVMRILIAIAVAQVLHQLRGSVAQMQGDRLIARLAHHGERLVNAQIGRVALRRGGQIDRGLCQGYAPFGPAYLHDRIEGGIGQQQRIGIGQTNVFGCRDDQPAGNELRVFPTLYHPCHPVECRIRIAAADALDKGRDNVVVHLPVFVVGQRILLQARHDQLVGNHHVAALRLDHQFQYVQQLAGIAAAIAKQSRRFLQFNLPLP